MFKFIAIELGFIGIQDLKNLLWIFDDCQESLILEALVLV